MGCLRSPIVPGSKEKGEGRREKGERRREKGENVAPFSFLL
jgi:hypothetical protein